MEFLRHTLANGLTIIAECNPAAYSTALGFFVQTGARDESAEVAGVSHFLEHMVFKGTPRRSADDVNREFDEMGAHYNAFTSEENTVYYAAVLPEQQAPATELLADILRPSLREADFDTEKQVIIEEIRMYDDQPPFGGEDKCRALHLGSHPLANSVLGTVESIQQLSVDQMRDYFRRRYSPGNITLVAAGQVDFAALVAQVERLCGDWPPVATSRETPAAESQRGFHWFYKEAATQEYLIQLSSGPAARDDDRFAGKLLAVVLGDDSGSRLYWELVDSGRAEQASLGHHDCQGAGLFAAYLCCEPEATVDNARRLAAVFRAAAADGISPAELAQAKSKVNSRVVLGSEKPRGRLFTVGGNWLQRREYRTVQQDLAAVDAVRCDQLAAVMARYPLDECTTVVIGPLRDVPTP